MGILLFIPRVLCVIACLLVVMVATPILALTGRNPESLPDRYPRRT